MDEIFVTIFKYIFDFLDIAFAEVSIIFLILGIVLFLLGATILALTVHTLITGQRIDGTVIGAVKDIRIKEKIRDGRIEKDRKETLHAIFEYIQNDGSTHQEKSCSGGSSVLKYKTGQRVKLIVCHQKEFNDVYDANDYSAPILGSILVVVGFGIIFQAASIYASFGISILALLGIIVSLVFKLFKGKNKKTGVRIHPNKFDPSKVRPIEEFIGEVD